VALPMASCPEEMFAGSLTGELRFGPGSDQGPIPPWSLPFTQPHPPSFSSMKRCSGLLALSCKAEERSHP
jgi:hypothetical protein